MVKGLLDEMPGRKVLEENCCNICCESFKFYNCLDKYFHFLRHYNEKTLKAGNASLSPFEREEARDSLQELNILVRRNKAQTQEDPRFQLSPTSRDWLDDNDLARLEASLSAMDRKKIDQIPMI